MTTIPTANPPCRATTVVAVRDGRGGAAMACDGQVTQGTTILKRSAVKVRTLRDGAVLAGFAGATADAMALFERFEGYLDTHRGDLTRAAVELAKTWRMDKYLQRLDAVLLAVDRTDMLIVGGTGDVVAPDDPFAAVGSGAGYAVAALKGMYGDGTAEAPALARRALEIASELCVFTNDHITVVELDGGQQ